jgi:hypothetical protein
MSRRPVRAVPRIIVAALAAGLALQAAWVTHLPPSRARPRDLGPPPALATARLMVLGEPIAGAQWLALSLQGYGDQAGADIPFRALDYRRLVAWLTLILALDPQGQYPLILASHVYSQVPDRNRQRLMLDFVYRAFFKDPQRRWPWLAHAALLARHRLHDLPLSLRYAQAVAAYTKGKNVPHWARQMPIFILQDMGELQAAKIELGALLASGTVRDPREVHFLLGRYRELERRLGSERASALHSAAPGGEIKHRSQKR